MFGASIFACSIWKKEEGVFLRSANVKTSIQRKSCLLRGGDFDDPVSSSKSTSLDGAD
jgi:hypothetical protein